MTQEEKAKAYDAFVKKAKDMYDKENDVILLHALEEFFPELQENEDERIRKAIIELLKNCDSVERYLNPFSVSIFAAISWLEKQGEQKPI